MVLGILGASLNAPQLKEITWASEMRKQCVFSHFLFHLTDVTTFPSTIDEMDSRLGFANFVTRGRNFLSRPSDMSGKKEL